MTLSIGGPGGTDEAQKTGYISVQQKTFYIYLPLVMSDTQGNNEKINNLPYSQMFINIIKPTRR